MYPHSFIFEARFTPEQLQVIQNSQIILTEFIQPLSKDLYSSKLCLSHSLIQVCLSLKSLTTNTVNNSGRYNSYELLITIVKLDMITEYLIASHIGNLELTYLSIKSIRDCLSQIATECYNSSQV